MRVRVRQKVACCNSHPSMIMGTGQICIGHRALDGTARLGEEERGDLGTQ